MASVTCPHCGLNYNDTFRWTFCPHEKFEASPSAKALLRSQGHPVDEAFEDRPTDSVA